MKFSLWTHYGALNSKPVFDALKKGIKRTGFSFEENSKTSDVDVIWSVLWNGRMARNYAVWKEAQKKNKPVIVLETGGIRRGTTWKVGLNGINRDAYFAPSNNDSSRALQLGLSLRPWQQEGKYILICGQHDKSEQWQGQPCITDWLINTVREIRKHTDRSIVFRPHPRCPVKIQDKKLDIVFQKPMKSPGSYDDYDLRFQGAHCVVSWSSNPGVHAVINGIPAFVGPSSLAYPVGNTDYSLIESPLMPDRTQWLNDYAHTEYTLDEISTGIPLNYLTKKLI